MKKSVKYYLICWVVLVALFNVVCFMTLEKIAGVSKFTGSFWVGYAFIKAAFVAHFAFMYKNLSAKDKETKVLGIPLMILSIIELCIMLIAGLLCMLLAPMPYWVGVIVCSAILVFSIISLVTAKGVGENTSQANINLNRKTDNYRKMVDAADMLLQRAATTEEKALVQKVYDAVRYSDAESSTETAADEAAILDEIGALTLAFANREDFAATEQRVNELLLLIAQRNNKSRKLCGKSIYSFNARTTKIFIK